MISKYSYFEVCKFLCFLYDSGVVYPELIKALLYKLLLINLCIRTQLYVKKIQYKRIRILNYFIFFI